MLRFGVLLALLGLIGCVHPRARLQSDDSEREKVYDLQTIGDVTSVGNADPIPVSGVGLVINLDNTGGPAPPSGFRSRLEADLRKSSVQNIKELLNSPETALVLVSGLIRPGGRKNDPLDLEITLPPQSKVTSLRGGILTECLLYNYSSTSQINPGTRHGAAALIGHPLVKAEGPLLVGFGDGDESARLKRGRIWGGGRVQIDRPFFLVMNNNQQQARIALRVAERINETFQGPVGGSGDPLALAKTKEVVYLQVPHQYRHNLARFLRVVRLIPLHQTPTPGGDYRRRLDEDLLDPARTMVAALRLESLGTDSIPTLKKGLKSDHSLVRFSSAEALAYLGSGAGGDPLEQLALEEPGLRSYCLTALTAVDESIFRVKLAGLFANSSPELRYGAFMALRTLAAYDANVQGELLNESFWLHRVAPLSTPLVHMSTSRRPEIVLFGEEPSLEPPFSFLAGPEFTVTAAAGDQQCTLSRFSVGKGASRKQCGLGLADVLHTLADLGGTYPDAVDLIRQADRVQCLTSPVAVDALPEAVAVEQLARAGASGESRPDAKERQKARGDLSATPDLFQSEGRAPKRMAAGTKQ